VRGRDEAVALRALTAAIEAHTELVRQIIGRLDSIDGHVSVLIDTVADHIAHHGETT
jgi:hypothetical protein